MFSFGITQHPIQCNLAKADPSPGFAKCCISNLNMKLNLKLKLGFNPKFIFVNICISNLKMKLNLKLKMGFNLKSIVAPTF